MKFLLAIMAGCLFALAYFQLCPTFFSVILPILASSLLLFSWSKSTAKQAFFTGWLFGAIFFGLGISWVYVSIHEFGNIPIFEASGITLLFAIFLGLFPALQGYFLNKIFSPFLMNFFNTPQQKRLYKTPYLGNYLWPYYLLAFPALGCLLELLKSWIFTGFPWLEAGVTQIHGPLSGFAPILGSYGCSLILYFIAGLLTYSFQTFKNIKNSADPINATGPHTSKEIIYSDLSLIKICFPLILIFLIFVIGQLLSFKAWTQIIGQPILVSLIQGNIPQSLKWDEKNVINSLHIYYQESQKLPNSRFIIWPETAIPLDQINAQEYLGLVQDLLQKNNPTTALITGIPLIQSSNQYGDQYFNAAIILGNGHGVYQKNHLVPFGEYIPLREIFGIIFEFLNVPMSDFTAGSLHQPLMQSGAISNANFI